MLPCMTFCRWQFIMSLTIIAIAFISIFMDTESAKVLSMIGGVVNLILFISWVWGFFRDDCAYDCRGNYRGVAGIRPDALAAGR